MAAADLHKRGDYHVQGHLQTIKHFDDFLLNEYGDSSIDPRMFFEETGTYTFNNMRTWQPPVETLVFGEACTSPIHPRLLRAMRWYWNTCLWQFDERSSPRRDLR